MNSYKVSFANNQVTDSQIYNNRFDHDSEYLFEYMGQVKYAIVSATNEEDAKTVAKKLINNIDRGNRIAPRMAA